MKMYKVILPSDVFVSIFKREPTEAELWTGTEANASGNRKSGSEFIDVFAGFIHRHQKRPISFYAKAMGLSVVEFTMAVKAISGIAARDWLNDYINLEACELLKNTNKTVQEISLMLNFSPSAFGQFFLRKNKTTPQEWRRINNSRWR